MQTPTRFELPAHYDEPHVSLRQTAASFAQYLIRASSVDNATAVEGILPKGDAADSITDVELGPNFGSYPKQAFMMRAVPSGVAWEGWGQTSRRAVLHSKWPLGDWLIPSAGFRTVWARLAAADPSGLVRNPGSPALALQMPTRSCWSPPWPPQQSSRWCATPSPRSGCSSRPALSTWTLRAASSAISQPTLQARSRGGDAGTPAAASWPTGLDARPCMLPFAGATHLLHLFGATCVQFT
jgi:hypothetical protein